MTAASKIALVRVADELGEYFGIRVRVELNALGLELLLEVGEVLDDTVVNDGDGAAGVEVRVGVAIGGAAVRGPARVADAITTRCGLDRDEFAQFREAAGLLTQMEFVPGSRDHASAIVAAVFEAPEPFEQDRRCLAPARETNDSAHGRRSFSVRWAKKCTGVGWSLGRRVGVRDWRLPFVRPSG